MSTRVHRLKTWPLFFNDIADGRKAFEVRRDDRGGFDIGDVLALCEWDPAARRHTGREVYRRVSYVLKAADCPAAGLTDGFVVLGLAPLTDTH